MSDNPRGVYEARSGGVANTFGGATPEGHREIDVTVRVPIPFTWAVVAADLRSQIPSLSGKDAERRFYRLSRRAAPPARFFGGFVRRPRFPGSRPSPTVHSRPPW